MVDQRKNAYRPDEVSPPGETLRELLEERGMSQAELGTRMGRPKKTISEIMNGKAAITPETALQLELVLGVPARFWTEREAHFRQSLARRAQEAALAEAKDWAKRFPLRELEKRGLVPATRTSADKVRAVLEFFGVASPAQWDDLFGQGAVAYRTSPSFEADPGALAAWLRVGQLEATRIRTRSFDRARFLEELDRIRQLTVEPPEVFEPAVVERCAEAGVAVVFVPEFKGSRASGATRWLAPDKALMQLSLRYKSDDHLWFTFFHEAAHILFHKKREVFLEDRNHEGKMEDEANRWAGDFLIPPAKLAALLDEGRPTKASVQRFASELGIAPGIVVGRLQHDGVVPHRQMNDLKQRFEWA